MKYKALAVVSVHAGALVNLSKAQAARTAALVEPVDKPKGWARVVIPFQFKAGEVFETDMDFGKGYAGVVSLEDLAEQAKAAKAAADAKAKAEAEAAAEAEAKAKAEAEAAAEAEAKAKAEAEAAAKLAAATKP